MNSSLDANGAPNFARQTRGRRAKWVGPGLIMAASGIGASDIITASVGGAMYGRTLLWALVIGVFFKFVLSEGVARWQLATGTTLLEGWARYLPRWVLWLFAGYLVLWAVAVSGALVSGCGLAIENLTGGFIPRSWGGFAHGITAFLVIYSTNSSGFTRIIKPIIVLMFVSIVVCAGMTFRDPLATVMGILTPVIPSGAGTYVLSLIGGIGGSLTLLSYNYLPRENGEGDPTNLRAVRLDLAIAYVFTAVFGLSVMLIAERVFYSAGVVISDRDAVSRMAEQLGVLFGPAGFYVYSIGFWAAVMASVFGVWQTIPSVFADCYSLLRKFAPLERAAAARVSSPVYRNFLAFMALSALPFSFFGRPLLIIVAFTVLGSLFIPFLAATLLYLNNAVRWPSPVAHNRWITNGILVVVLLVFLIVGGLEVMALSAA